MQFRTCGQCKHFRIGESPVWATRGWGYCMAPVPYWLELSRPMVPKISNGDINADMCACWAGEDDCAEVES